MTLRNLTLLVILLSALLLHQNCGDVKLLKGQETILLSVDPTPTPGLDPSPTATPKAVEIDPIDPFIIGTKPQWPGPEPSPDCGFESASGLIYLSLSQLPSRCSAQNLNVDIAVGYKKCSASGNHQTHSLVSPSLVNITPTPTASKAMIAHHSIRFIRPPDSRILVFRFKTPPTASQIQIWTAGQFGDNLNDVWGETATSNCAYPDCRFWKNISLSKDPCNFDQNPATACLFGANASMQNLSVQVNDSTNPCVLKPDTYYYFNYRFVYPDVDDSSIGTHNRTVFDIRVYNP